MRLRFVLPLLACVPALLLAYTPAPADLGAEAGRADTTRHANLQVFPEDIEHEQLMAAMRAFRRALGVRCTHCHVRGEDGELDPASDDNPHKEVAREMMRMNQRLNDELASIEGLHEAEGFRVTCWTCHRGETTPATRWPEEDEAGEERAPRPEGPHDGHEHPEGHEHPGGRERGGDGR